MLSLLSVNISCCVFNGHYDVVRSRWKYLNSWEHFATVKMVVEVQTTKKRFEAFSSFKSFFVGKLSKLLNISVLRFDWILNM